AEDFTVSSDVLFKAAENCLVRHKVHFIEHDHFRTLDKFFIVERHLIADRPVVFNRIPAFGFTDVYDMDDDLRPLNMPEELMAEPRSFRGTFDQTRQVGHDK